MKLIEVSVKNFGSYDNAHINFKNASGLTLISGTTGSGKSTLLDFVPWVLFGKTSKNVDVEDVKSWFSLEITEGHCTIEVIDGIVTVHRFRGKKSADNDLYCIKNGVMYRGADINDTQKFINKMLGIDVNIFLNSAYVTQFSTIDQFFTAGSADRRLFFQKIVDLSFCDKLEEKVTKEKKKLKQKIHEFEVNLAEKKGEQKNIVNNLNNDKQSKENWDADHSALLAEYLLKSNDFENEKTKELLKLNDDLLNLSYNILQDSYFENILDDLSKENELIENNLKIYQLKKDKLIKVKTELEIAKKEETKYKKLTLKGFCPTCLGPSINNNIIRKMAQINNKIKVLKQQIVELESHFLSVDIKRKDFISANYLRIAKEKNINDELKYKLEVTKSNIKKLSDSVNTYKKIYEDEEKKVNPFYKRLNFLKNSLNDINLQIDDIENQKLPQVNRRLNGLDWLYGASKILRGVLLEQAIFKLAQNININLEKYFSANLRVSLSVNDEDKISIEINNSGYSCNYHQLSGGERCLLNFVLKFALIELSEDRYGIKFNVIMLDEILNGMDDNFKTKAFYLLQSLESRYDSIFLIDHCEALKNMFDNRIEICKISDRSVINNEF